MTDQDLFALSGIHPLSGFSVALTAQLPGSKINTPLRRAHFMAQCSWESTGFTKVEESLYFTHAERIHEVYKNLTNQENYVRNPEALGNAVYANRFGNGDVDSGDGYRYRGRGPLQHTFKDNYRELADNVGFNLVANPEALTQPDMGVKCSIYYFVSRGCCEAADLDNVKLVTEKINGGTNGLDERIALTAKAIGLKL